MHQSNTISQQSNQPLISHQEEMADTSQDDGMEGALQQYGAEEESYEDYGEYGDQGYGVDQNMAVAAVQDGNKGVPQTPEDLDSFIERADGKHFCTICRTFSHSIRHHVRNHVESKHFPTAFTYSCPHCGKQTNTRKALENHVYKCRKDTSF